MIVHVLGASGRSGAALCRALVAAGSSYVPVVRSASRWAATQLPGEPRIADLRDSAALEHALAGATHVVSCAHARHAPAVLAAAPPEGLLVLLGSTRKFTRWPDAHGDGVLAGERAFLASGRRGVMLHPTMIYGAEGENNVQRLAKLLHLLPFMPLPDGGQALVQPVFQGDVTRAILAALEHPWRGPHALVVAGAEAMPYVAFVQAVARASGAGRIRVLGVPAPLLRLAASMARVVPGLPRIGGDEIRRLGEDKAFSIAPLREVLGVEPVRLAVGLARMQWPR